MARLPSPGADSGVWGSILNAYLLEAHNADGTLKANSVNSGAVVDGAINSDKLAAGSGTNGQVLTKDSTSAGGMKWSTSAAAATNLSSTATATSVTVASSSGDDATIPAATTGTAGVMSAADKTKLDGLTQGGSNVRVYQNYADAPALPVDTIVISRTGQ